MTYKILLINMPFADAHRPSLSLTQLKTVTAKTGADTEVLYLNQDYAQYFGIEFYESISRQYINGLGDWLFRHIAFPEHPDNRDAYLGRHFPFQDPQTEAFKAALLEKRAGLSTFTEQLIENYHITDAQLLGFTSLFSQNVPCFAMARMVKDRNPAVVTVMGGANCETPMGQEIVKNIDQIDFAFSGPALISFPEMVSQRMAGNTQACEEIPGVFSKNNVASLKNGQLIGKELPLDQSVTLDYQPFIDAFDKKFPKLKGNKLLTFETSRGCWWGARSHCTFCGLNGETMNYRAMTAAVAIEQFDAMFAYAGDCSHYFCVDNILPQNYTKDVFPKLNPPPHIDIFYEVKSNLSEAEIQLLSEKRVKGIQPGIESLSSPVLKLMKKGTTAFGNVTFLKYCALHDVAPVWNLLVGFPREKEDVYHHYMKNLPLLVHLPPPGGCFPIRFDRYSPYFKQAEAYGLELQPQDFYKFVYPLEPASLNNLAYFFQDRNYDAEYIQVTSKWIMKLQQLAGQWIARWNDKDGLPHPRLHFVNESSDRIYDSRGDQPLEYDISPTSRKLLDLLVRPKTLTSLAPAFADQPDFDPAKEVAGLQERGLIFQEGTRYQSLVFPRKGSNLKDYSHLA